MPLLLYINMIQVIGVRDQRLHTTTLAATSLYKYDTKLLEFETNVFTPLLLLNVQESKAEVDVTMSQYNMAHVSIIMDLVVKLIDLPGVRASNILILTFYKAQLSVLTKSIDKLDEARPNHWVKSIIVRTVDCFLGSEHYIIILDCVVTKSIGFVRQRQRLNLSTFRAMDGLYIAANYQAIKFQSKTRTKWLMNVLHHCLKFRYNINMQALSRETYNQYLPGQDELIAQMSTDAEMTGYADNALESWGTAPPVWTEEGTADVKDDSEEYQLGANDDASDGEIDVQ